MDQQSTDFIRTLIIGLWLDIDRLCPGIDQVLGEKLCTSLIETHGFFAFTEELPRLDTKLMCFASGVDEDFVLSSELTQLWLLFEPYLVRGKEAPLSSTHAFEALRQLALIGKKLRVEPREGCDEAMKQRFIATDLELPTEITDFPILVLARRYLASVLPKLSDVTFRGRHGAGAVAEGKKAPPGRRWDIPLQTTPKLLKLVGCSVDYLTRFAPNEREIELIEDFMPSRVTTVPKDGRGPRIICTEPHGLMFHELAVMDVLYQHMNTHPLLRGRANVLDQQINRDLARKGSINKQYATIDLSEASDRVSFALVRSLFPPEWFAVLDACRNPKFDLGGDTFSFKKFAPMGSALCFPVETLVFVSLAVATIARESGWSLEVASREVVVHGDDTIVPSHYAQSVMKTFEDCYLKVNHDKSFTTGFFRESCGGDYYHGHDVTPVRWNNAITGDSNEDIFSITNLANSFYKKGWWGTARSLRSWMCIQHRHEPFWFTGRTDYEPHGSGFYSFVWGGGSARSWHHPTSNAIVKSIASSRRVSKSQPSQIGCYRRYNATRRKAPLDEVIETAVVYDRESRLRRTLVPIQSCDAGLLAVKGLSTRLNPTRRHKDVSVA